MAPTPDIADTERIARSREPIIRNLRITQCYFDLSTALQAPLGGEANWCTFATWASKQAGQTIRKEDLGRLLEDGLRRSAATRRAVRDLAAGVRPRAGARALGETERAIWDLLNPAAAVDRASSAVARGNRKVFAEIGREFARFAPLLTAEAGYDQSRIDAFCAMLRAGSPPRGQGFLRQAFAHYYRARFEADPVARAQLVLCANLEIGFHEQTRLQPEIRAALDAATEDTHRDIRAGLMRGLPKLGGPDTKTRLRRSDSPLEDAVNRLGELVRSHIRRFLTAHLMTLTVSGTRLNLGDDLTAPFPPALAEISEPELANLLSRVDPTPNSLSGTGAGDWSDLAERLHYIADLFRAFQQRPEMWDAPFTPDQVSSLTAGVMPGGRL